MPKSESQRSLVVDAIHSTATNALAVLNLTLTIAGHLEVIVFAESLLFTAHSMQTTTFADVCISSRARKNCCLNDSGLEQSISARRILTVQSLRHTDTARICYQYGLEAGTRKRGKQQRDGFME